MPGPGDRAAAGAGPPCRFGGSRRSGGPGGGLELQELAGLPVAGLRIEGGLRSDQRVDEREIDPVKLRRRLDRGPDFALRRRRLDGRTRAGGKQTTKTQPD